MIQYVSINDLHINNEVIVNSFMTEILIIKKPVH